MKQFFNSLPVFFQIYCITGVFAVVAIPLSLLVSEIMQRYGVFIGIVLAFNVAMLLVGFMMKFGDWMWG